MTFEYIQSQSNQFQQQNVQSTNGLQNIQPFGNAAAQEQLAYCISGTPMLSRGDRGTRVQTLQRMLNKVGASLIEDGIFGLQTHRALRIFQGNQGLSRDAILGPLTAQALNTICQSNTNIFSSSQESESQTEATESVVESHLSKGSAGAAVKDLQRLLNTHNAGLVVDGEFGPLTESAVKAFQQANDLDITGVANTTTMEALNAHDATAIGTSTPVEAESAQEWRDAVLSKAASHLGKLYSWGGNGPSVFDCSGFVLYVLREETGLMNWGDDTAAGISNRVPATNAPKKGDLVFYSGSNGITHIEFYTGSGSQTLGASGGGSSTYANNPNAKVQYGDYAQDGRTKTFGSILGLIENKVKLGA